MRPAQDSIVRLKIFPPLSATQFAFVLVSRVGTCGCVRLRVYLRGDGASESECRLSLQHPGHVLHISPRCKLASWYVT